MNTSIQVLGDFELIRELGRGGMGIVYEARQVSLNRKVALKVLKASLGLTTQAVNRFRREAAAAAKLHHTNIVPIYATGEDGDFHFYAMELIEGSSLDGIIREARREREGVNGKVHEANEKAPGPTKRAMKGNEEGVVTVAADESDASDLSSSHLGETTATLQSGTGYFDQVGRMFAEVADGLEHAHRQGVIHRDIKPSNLLVSPQGRLHLTDFGLARVLEEPGMTVTGEFMGSPLYMSPEQIAAGRAPLDQRTDIYSLGVTLYEALTLQPPFQGERRDQIIAQILYKEPRPPRAVDRKIPPDLETICLKAMDKDPDRRYRTARAFAEDLRRYVNRFAIEARRANVSQRTVKWVRRHPAVAIAVGAVVIALLLVGVFARKAQLANRRFIEEQRRAAIQEAVLAARSGDLPAAEKAMERAEELHASAADVRLLRGQIALHQLHYSEAILHLEQAVRLLPESVTARALLAVGYWYSSSSDQMEETLDRIDQLTAKTPEDFLFRGQAVVGLDPERALESMDEGIKRGDSLMARVLRAEARGRYATLTADPADARLGLADIAIARSMKPNNPDVLKVSLGLHTLAARLFGRQGMDRERQGELDLGEQDMRALETVQTPPAAMVKGWYWIELGDEAAALREWGFYAEGSNDEARQWLLEFYVPVLYRRGEFAKALTLLERHPTRGMLEPRCFLMAELSNGPDRAYAALQAAAGEKIDSWNQFGNLIPLQLLGRPTAAEAAFRALRPRFHVPWRNHWYERLLDYELDQITEEALIALAGKSQWNLCEGHYFVAVRRLSHGDRAGAAAHFRKSIDTTVPGFYENEWSRGFLSRLEADPKWPPWIP